MMSGQHADDLITLAARLAERLPDDGLRALATAVQGGAPAVRELKNRAGSATVRAACDDLARALDHGADGAYLAGCLAGANRAAALIRHQTAIDVVWTGPESDVHTSRLTGSVVIQLIDEAQVEILLVSYATVPPPALTAALQRAVARDVQVTVLLERPQDNPHFTGSSNAFDALDVRRYSWPAGQRPSGASLHAKLLVVDRRTALVGSANLTGHAMERNLECGVLLRSAQHAAAIADHVLGLHEKGTLRRL